MKRNSREAEARFSADWREGNPGDWFPGQPIAHIAGTVRGNTSFYDITDEQRDAIYRGCVLTHAVEAKQMARNLGVTLSCINARVMSMRRRIAKGKDPFIPMSPGRKKAL